VSSLINERDKAAAKLPTALPQMKRRLSLISGPLNGSTPEVDRKRVPAVAGGCVGIALRVVLGLLLT
jgi:hypothetical protein